MNNKIISVTDFVKRKLKKKKKYRNFDINKNFFDQGIDSLDFMKLIFEIENYYNISIDANLYTKLNSAKIIQMFVKKNLIK
jgi:acyl carrier protein